MPEISYQEKSLYGSLAAELLVYSPYFLLHRTGSVGNLAGTIVAIIVLQSLIAAFTRQHLKDERDRLLELRGYRVGYLTLASLMVVGLGMVWAHTTLHPLPVDTRVLGLHFLNVFFGILVLSDIAKTVAQIEGYRSPL